MYIYTYIYIYIYILYIYIYREREPWSPEASQGDMTRQNSEELEVMLRTMLVNDEASVRQSQGTYTRSPLEDSRLFGPSPWKVLATTYEQSDY